MQGQNINSLKRIEPFHFYGKGDTSHFSPCLKKDLEQKFPWGLTDTANAILAKALVHLKEYLGNENIYWFQQSIYALHDIGAITHTSKFYNSRMEKLIESYDLLMSNIREETPGAIDFVEYLKEPGISLNEARCWIRILEIDIRNRSHLYHDNKIVFTFINRLSLILWWLAWFIHHEDKYSYIIWNASEEISQEKLKKSMLTTIEKIKNVQ